jgi:hydrogenase maturation protease
VNWQKSDDAAVAPILVLGVGNVLLADDGVGPRLAHELQALYSGVDAVECVDGGTQGLALLAYFTGRDAVIILDAFSAGKKPGTVTVLEGPAVLGCGATRATTAHEGNAGELLATAHLLGDLPERLFLVGIEPERVQTELGLSDCVATALPVAFTRACEIIELELARIEEQQVA